MKTLRKSRMLRKKFKLFVTMATIITATVIIGFLTKPLGTIVDKREFDRGNVRVTGMNEQHGKDTCSCDVKYSKDTQPKRKFLTLFTTFADEEPLRYTVQNNTICNYMNFPEDLVHLVVFVNEATKNYQFNENITLCGGHVDSSTKRWHMVILPKASSYLGRPLLRDMFLYVMREFDSELYMYTNGDILYPWRHLERSFRAVMAYSERHDLHQHIILGLRKEVTFYSGAGSDVRQLYKGNDEEVLEIGNNYEPTRPYALDFFVTSRTSFPWASIPPFIIGSVRYDGWLVMYANKLKIPIFDITLSTPVVHQAGIPKIANKIALQANNYNLQLFKESIPNNKNYGRIKQCAHFRTVLLRHRVKVIKNYHYERECMLKGMLFLPIL